jgi:hypothetical protein
MAFLTKNALGNHAQNMARASCLQGTETRPFSDFGAPQPVDRQRLGVPVFLK